MHLSLLLVLGIRSVTVWRRKRNEASDGPAACASRGTVCGGIGFCATEGCCYRMFACKSVTYGQKILIFCFRFRESGKGCLIRAKCGVNLFINFTSRKITMGDP